MWVRRGSACLFVAIMDVILCINIEIYIFLLHLVQVPNSNRMLFLLPASVTAQDFFNIYKTAPFLQTS